MKVLLQEKFPCVMRYNILVIHRTNPIFQNKVSNHLRAANLCSEMTYNIVVYIALQWRYNVHYVVSNHQPHDCLLNSLCRRRSKNIKALRHWPLCGELRGIHGWPVNSPHKWQVTQKMFPFDDVTTYTYCLFSKVNILFADGLGS